MKPHARDASKLRRIAGLMVNGDPLKAEARRSGSIMVADRDPVLRRRLAIALGMDGHRVTEVGSQRVMLDLLSASLMVETALHEVLICSVTLPGWSGLNMLQALSETRALPWIILLRDCSTDDFLAAAYRAGAAAVLDRDVEPGEMRASVNEVLAWSRL